MSGPSGQNRDGISVGSKSKIRLPLEFPSLGTLSPSSLAHSLLWLGPDFSCWNCKWLYKCWESSRPCRRNPTSPFPYFISNQRSGIPEVSFFRKTAEVYTRFAFFQVRALKLSVIKDPWWGCPLICESHLNCGSWAKVRGGGPGRSVWAEGRPPGLHRHPNLGEEGLEARFGLVLCSLLRLSRELGNRGQGWRRAWQTWGRKHWRDPGVPPGRQWGKEKKRSFFFLSFFLNLFPFPIFLFSFLSPPWRLGCAMSLCMRSLYHFLFLAILQGMQDPLSSTRVEPCAPCIGAWEVPGSFPKLRLPQAPG